MFVSCYIDDRTNYPTWRAYSDIETLKSTMEFEHIENYVITVKYDRVAEQIATLEKSLDLIDEIAVAHRGIKK